MKTRLAVSAVLCVLFLSTGGASLAWQSPLPPRSSPLGDDVMATIVAKKFNGYLRATEQAQSVAQEELLHQNAIAPTISYACFVASHWWGFDIALCESG
jgi:hypothetical protein